MNPPISVKTIYSTLMREVKNMPDEAVKWVLMDTEKRCIVKGKSRKYLVGIDEPTKKELVVYSSSDNAMRALKRSYILCSDYVLTQYGEIERKDIMPVETI